MIASVIVAGFGWAIQMAAPHCRLGARHRALRQGPPMQMHVMKYGKAAPALAATANTSALNIANALGGLIGGAIVDSLFGANATPFAAAVVPALALLFILPQERSISVAPALSRPSLKEATL
jgi:predicted MFS family arabinose efflux permease